MISCQKLEAGRFGEENDMCPYRSTFSTTPPIEYGLQVDRDSAGKRRMRTSQKAIKVEERPVQKPNLKGFGVKRKRLYGWIYLQLLILCKYGLLEGK